MAVSGPLFRDLTPPNLESRTNKNAPGTLGRSFQRAVVCLTGPLSVRQAFRVLVFGVRSAALGPRYACLLVACCYFACAVGKSCLWAWQSSDLGDPGALEGTTRPGEALIFLLYPVRGQTEHRISYRGPAVPVLEPLNP